MKKLIPLFISYFYPPAGGSGLPGSQRTVKFIRYLQNAESVHVLTLKPECYPKELQLNFNLSLPINGEIIVREESKDKFQQLMQIRSRFNSLFANKKNVSDGNGSFDHVNSVACSVAKGKMLSLQQLKDFTHDFYYFPDQIAGPWLKPAVRAGVRLVKHNNINIIFATGMPWTALVVGRLISHKTGVPFIADFRDPWQGNPFLKSKGMLLDWRDRLCEQKVVEQAALITANTIPLRDEFIEHYPHVPAEKIISLPNGFDTKDFEHLSNLMQQKQEDSKKLILMHAGFLYGKRDPAPLFDALDQLRRNHPDLSTLVEFHQYGGITTDYDINQRYKKLIDEGIIKLFGQIPFDECLSKLVRADILIIIQPGTKTQVPSKLYDYLCINRPVLTITPLDGALGVMIREKQFGDIFAPEETEKLMKRLAQYSKLRQEGQLLDSPNYSNRDKFDVRHIACLLEEKMMQIVSSSSCR
jgi:Glycosyl transferase 4-like domain